MNRVVVITGAAGGLGQALCRCFAEQGATVVALDHDPLGLQHLQTRLGDGTLFCSELDIRDATAIRLCFARLIEQHGRIDILINNAGITQISAAPELSADTLDQVMAVNFRGAALCAIAAMPALRESGGSHVAISSVAGFAPLSKRSVYCASKHAMNGFFDTLRAEEREHGVHVLVVYPSFIATNPGSLNAKTDIQRPGAADDAIDPMSPDQAAVRIVRAIAARAERLSLGRVAVFSYWIARLSPTLYEYLMRRSLAKT
ncbi:MAG: SDR family NAD(P)-dependent oxidoreductase [Granulosicoccaceae bacterium]